MSQSRDMREIETETERLEDRQREQDRQRAVMLEEPFQGYAFCIENHAAIGGSGNAAPLAAAGDDWSGVCWC